MPAQKATSEKLTIKQKRFCDEYLVDFNATQAALRAGYSAASAYSTGWENLRKPEIKAYIDERLAELSLSSGEVLKSMSDIARGDLKEYFITRKQVHTPKVTISLAEYVERLKEDIENTEYIHEIALAQELLGTGKILEKAISLHERKVQLLKLALIPHEVRLVKEPLATMIVDGPPTLVDVAELDVARLVQDKAAGKIKSYQVTNGGVKVELYHADEALDKLAKHHGLYEKDNKLDVDHTTDGKPIGAQPDLSVLTDEELRTRAAIDRKLYGLP